MKRISTIFLILIIPMTVYSKYWQKIDLPTGYTNNLWLDVYFLESNPNYGWICGFGGQVLRTTNRGQSWQGSTISAANQLESIHFANSSTGFTSGPEGIFKTTNGGASWINITPDMSGRYWGNYMVDNNFGLVVGGGCVTNQEFRYTTDGGNTWVLNQQTTPNTGLTDVIILQKDGLGFASSSGMIWITNDGGINWSIFKSSGSNVWQEELSYTGGSFLVPYAGTSCQGDGGDGGMRFSSDYGNNWRSTSVGVPMYGCFLNSSSEGWGCGVNQAVVHTTNSGLQWRLKNCGIESGDLDDIWFINDNEGFVVGDGVYKLSDPIAELSGNDIKISSLCLNEVVYDTIWVKNYSFYNEDAVLSFDGDFLKTYSVVSPSSLNFTLQSCEYLPIIIKITAEETGTHNATLTLTYKPGEGSLEEDFVINLEVTVNENTARPERNKFIIDSVYCNIPEIRTVKWDADKNDEYLDKIIKEYGNPQFYNDANPPLKILSTGTNINYGCTILDTGWTTETFRHQLFPCDTIIDITFDVYAYSSIIVSEPMISLETDCDAPLIDSVEITNTGNFDLYIDDVLILEPNNDITLLGWENGTLRDTIGINKSKFFTFRYNAVNPGFNTYHLRFVNNDSTKINGDKNPYDIEMNVLNNTVQIAASDTIINLDSICIGDETSKSIKLINYGSRSATVNKPKLKEGFTIFSMENFPLNIPANDSVSITIIYTPVKRGLISDTLTFDAFPCDKSVTVVVNGFGYETELTANPNYIDKFIQSGEIYKDTIEVTNNSNIPLTINNLSIIPNPFNIDFIIKPDVPFDIEADSSFDVIITYIANIDTSFSGKLLIEAEGECNTDLEVPIKLVSQSRLVEHEPASIDFGIFYCDIPDEQYKITLKNKGVRNDTIIDYILSGDVDNFHLFGFDTPMEIEDELEFYVYFNPKSEGSFDTEIIITTKDPNGQTIKIPVHGEYYKSDFSLIDDEEKPLEIVEHCDDTLFYDFRFVNNGQMTDTLTISVDNSLTEGIYIIDDTKEVKRDDTVRFEIFIIPNELSKIKLYDYKLNVNAEICDYYRELKIPVERILPKLTYEPKTIEFLNLWMKDVVYDTIKISNSSNFDLTVTDIYTETTDPEIIILKNPGFVVPVNQIVEVPIEYTAKQEGNSSNKLFFVAERNCPDTNFVNIDIQVEDEIYNLDLFIDEYVVFPGDKVDIDLELNGSVYKFYPEETSLGVKFNERLFYPENVYISDNGNFVETDYEVNNSILNVTIPAEQSEVLFTKPGKLLRIRGTALAYVPNETPLEIIDPEFLPENMDIFFEKDHGKLTVTNFCEQDAIVRRLIPGSFEAEISNINSSNIQIDIKANDKVNVKYELIDSFGKYVVNDNFSYQKGLHQLFISTDNIASGVYYLKLSDGIRMYSKKIIIVK